MANLALEVTSHGTIRAAFQVFPFGLGPAEAAVLQRMFTLALGRPLRYQLLSERGAEFAHLFLVDSTNATAVSEWRLMYARTATPTIFIGDQVTDTEWPSIRRPLLLPRVLSTLDQVAKTAAEQHLAVMRNGPGGAPQRVMTVLVVDDSEPVREFMKAALARYRINPVQAQSGEEALVKLLDRNFDVVFLDVVMTGLDGYEVCRQIKSKKGASPTKVVMLTSKDGAFDRIRGALAGCDAYLGKPVDESRLNALLKRYAAELSVSISA